MSATPFGRHENPPQRPARRASRCASTARPSAAGTSPCRWKTPETFEEFEYIRWFLLHDRASVFKEEGDWYLLVHTTCKHLQSDNRCGIYETRPQICRDYTTDNCEYDDDWIYDFYLETPEQVWEYTEAVLQDPLGRPAASAAQTQPAGGDQLRS